MRVGRLATLSMTRISGEEIHKACLRDAVAQCLICSGLKSGVPDHTVPPAQTSYSLYYHMKPFTGRNQRDLYNRTVVHHQSKHKACL